MFSYKALFEFKLCEGLCLKTNGVFILKSKHFKLVLFITYVDLKKIREWA